MCGQAAENSAPRMHAQNAFKTGRRSMPLFITYASYSHSGVKGLVNKPSDRSAAVKVLIEKAGGKFVALYNTTGSNDVVLVSELADGSDAVAIGTWLLQQPARCPKSKPFALGRQANSKVSRKRPPGLP